MSVQFGRWHFGGLPPAPEYLEKASEFLARYGPDGESRYSAPGVDIIYRAFHTTRESRHENQPQRLPSGAMLTWDGRLDNRNDLVREFPERLSLESGDAEIAAAAYEECGTHCFARLIGDWALSVWDPRERTLVLAKDFLGARHLYYAHQRDHVAWSTILDPLLLLAGKPFQLEEEYIAGWLARFPDAQLTPYHGILAVRPSTFVRITSQKQLLISYWSFNPRTAIRYAREEEYEEHFRAAFGQAVRRRLRSETTVIAELSGGMDSSSIVCVAEQLIARNEADAPRLETISYYDDSEPNWNELPYIQIVEKLRGRMGCHIDLGAKAIPALPQEWFASTPSHAAIRPPEADRQFSQYIETLGSRVLLSGVGGDEFTGGVPTPTPELGDLMMRLRAAELAKRLKAWALVKRQPWFHLVIDVARRFLPLCLVGLAERPAPPEWLNSAFLKRQSRASSGYRSRWLFTGALPSFQEHLCAVAGLRRQLAAAALPCQPVHEIRYPYLDRDLLEFVCAIPREQLVRPGQRRSLMRRSLAGIVPAELLNRRRKAFAIRKPTIHVTEQIPELFSNPSETLFCAALGAVDAHALLKEPERARRGDEVQVVALLRAMQLEFWLREIGRRGLLGGRATRNASVSLREDRGTSRPPSNSRPGTAIYERR